MKGKFDGGVFVNGEFRINNKAFRSYTILVPPGVVAYMVPPGVVDKSFGSKR